MKKQQIKAVALSTVLSASALVSALAVANPTLDKIQAVSQSKVNNARASQVKINKLQEQTSKLLAEYKQVNKEIDGLKVYNKQMERRIEAQKKVMDDLDQSIANVVVIQRQIPPLITTQLDTMQQFVELDAPFKTEQRLKRIEKQRSMQDNAAVSVAEKFRQVIELYNIEAEYARKIDTYRESLKVNGETLEVNMLAIGRIALLFQTTDGSRTGAWDRKSNQWVELDDEVYRKSVSQGIRMAQKKASNDILTLPIPAPEAAK